MKKFLSLALLCLFTIVTYGANITIDGVIYVTNSDGTTCYVNGHTLSITELIVPETIEDGDDSYTVTSVGTDAFNAYSDPTLTLVSLPATITELKARAFHNQTNLTTIICYAETAPSVTTNSFGSVSATVYVPDESIADYESVWTSSTAGATSLTFKGLSEYGDGSEPEPTEYVLSFYPENGGEMTIPEDGLTEIIVSCEDGISVGSFGTHTWRVSGDEGSVSVTKVVTADDGKSLTVSFSSAITTAGTYSLQYSNRGSWANTVPAGSFLLGPDEVESEEMEYSFTLVEAEEPSLDIVTVIDGIAYHISNGEAAVASYQVNYEGTTLTGAITIPVSVEYEGETYNVTSIEEYAYDGQEGLTSVDCQAHITYVGKHAFYHCYGVETFYIYEETPPTAEGTSFTHIGNDKCVLYVPDGLIGTYGSQQGWADFLNYDDMSNAPQPEQTVAWEVSPEQGVTDSFSSVKITFTDSETLSINENNTLQLYKDGDLYAYAIQYQMKNNYVTYYFYPDEWGDGGQMTIEEAGTYTLTIPAKQYLVDGVVYDEAIELEYIIEGEEEPLYTVEPSEDEPLTSLSSVTFIAEGAICWTEEVAVSEVKVYKDNEVVATGSALNSTWTSGTWDDAEEIVFDTELTESGEYKVVVPAGFFFLGSWTNMNNVIELNYTIEAAEEPSGEHEGDYLTPEIMGFDMSSTGNQKVTYVGPSGTEYNTYLRISEENFRFNGTTNCIYNSTSVGYLRKVIVTTPSDVTGYTLIVQGSDEPLTYTNLPSPSTYGEALGSIVQVPGESATLEIEGDYRYFSISLSTSYPGYSTYPSSIELIWEEATEEPTPSVDTVVVIDGIAYHISDGEAAVASYQVNYVDEGATVTGSITIPVSVNYNGEDYPVTSIEAYAYQDQNGLLSVDCQAHITSVGENAFNNCQYLETFYIYEEEVPSAVHSSFSHVGGLTEGNVTLYVPAGTKGAYAMALGWNNFLNVVEIASDPSEADFTITFDPGEGETVTSVSEVYVSREDGIYFDLENGLQPSNILSIRDDGGNTVAYATTAGEVYDPDYIIAPVGYAFTLDTTLDADGTYTIVIAANTAQLYYGGGDNYVYNEEEVTSTFFIGEAPYTYTVDPVSGTAVTSLSQVAIYCETGMMVSNLYDIRDIIVYNSNRVEVTTIQEIGAVYDENAPLDANDLGEILVFETELTDEDTYNVIIPAKFFYFYDNENNEYYSPRMSLYYTISEDGQTPGSYELTIDPEDGSELTSLSTITLSYGGGITTVLMPENDIVVYNSRGTEVAYVDYVNEYANSSGRVTSVEIVLNTVITEPGRYSVNIGAGYFQIGSSSNSMNSQIILSYTIVEDRYTQLCEEIEEANSYLDETWNTIVSEYPDAVSSLQDSYNDLVVRLAELQTSVDAQHDGGTLDECYDADEAEIEAIREAIAQLLANASGDTTGLYKVGMDYSNMNVYTLGGQKINAPTMRGVYIIDGRKVLVK